jgi:hypothetical protein
MTFASYSDPWYVRISRQTQFQLNNIVYIFHAKMGVTGITAQTLLKYDLANHAYINTSSYNFLSLYGTVYYPQRWQYCTKTGTHDKSFTFFPDVKKVPFHPVFRCKNSTFSSIFDLFLIIFIFLLVHSVFLFFLSFFCLKISM